MNVRGGISAARNPIPLACSDREAERVAGSGAETAAVLADRLRYLLPGSGGAKWRARCSDRRHYQRADTPSMTMPLFVHEENSRCG